MKLVEKFTLLVATSAKREPLWFISKMSNEKRERLMQLDEPQTPIWLTVALADHFDEKPDNVLHWSVDPLLPVRDELLTEIRDFLYVARDLDTTYEDMAEVWSLGSAASFRNGPGSSPSGTRNRKFWKMLFEANMS